MHVNYLIQKEHEDMLSKINTIKIGMRTNAEFIRIYLYTFILKWKRLFCMKLFNITLNTEQQIKLDRYHDNCWNMY